MHGRIRDFPQSTQIRLKIYQKRHLVNRLKKTEIQSFRLFNIK
nr:MAG TPA: hypothetical protein [Caudoviricetes sp.]